MMDDDDVVLARLCNKMTGVYWIWTNFLLFLLLEVTKPGLFAISHRNHHCGKS
jgi:hypothetical protein